MIDIVQKLRNAVGAPAGTSREFMIEAADEITDLRQKLDAANLMWNEGAAREGNLLVENDRLRAALQAFVEIPDLSADISESWVLMTAAFAGAKAALTKPEGGRQ